jgi:hypothetical protein
MVHHPPYLFFSFLSFLFFQFNGFKWALFRTCPAFRTLLRINLCYIFNGDGIRRAYFRARATCCAGFFVYFCRHYHDLLSFWWIFDEYTYGKIMGRMSIEKLLEFSEFVSPAFFILPGN